MEGNLAHFFISGIQLPPPYLFETLEKQYIKPGSKNFNLVILVTKTHSSAEGKVSSAVLYLLF